MKDRTKTMPKPKRPKNFGLSAPVAYALPQLERLRRPQAVALARLVQLENDAATPTDRERLAALRSRWLGGAR